MSWLWDMDDGSGSVPRENAEAGRLWTIRACFGLVLVAISRISKRIRKFLQEGKKL